MEAKRKETSGKEFTKGIIRENPVLRLVLGCCATLAVTTAASNAIGMGAATTFVLVCSNAVISLLRNVIPNNVREFRRSSPLSPVSSLLCSCLSKPFPRWTPPWAYFCP